MYQPTDQIRLPPKWIELNLCKRECSTFICTQDDELLCQCGKRKQDHDEEILAHPIRALRGTEWSPQKHTVTSPTDAYGQIVFEGEHHPNKSRFVRLSYDTCPEVVIQLMTMVWGLEMPKLVITVRGGTNNFDLLPRMGKMLQVGLLKAAKSTGAWIFSNGLNKGVTRHIGNALANERWLGFKRGRCISVGIAPWGLVEHRNDLIGRNRDRVYVPFEHPGGKFILLNPRHSNFMLVDNGSVGKPGGDVYFRKRLEKHLSTYPMSPQRGCDTPIVSVIIEGGLYTLKTIAEYLTDEPPIPVVVLGHTGRTADILQYVLRKCDHVKDLETIKGELQTLIIHFYKISINQTQLVLAELKKIIFKKNLLTIYVPHQSEDEGFDTVLLASIFRSQHWTPLQQLSLTLAWNRVDIATNEVFVYGREWSREHLEHAMMEALVSNRLDFVNLLLEHGLNMQTFLTPARLEGLYSLERTHSFQMRTLLFELAKIRSRKQNFASTNLERSLTLHDVGLAMSHMMGHIYKSKYIHLKGMRDMSNSPRDDNIPGAEEDDDQNIMNVHCFTQPFDDLFIWAILTKRHDMALLLWGHGPGALAKALVAVKLNSYLAQELISTEKTNMGTEFQMFSEEWENLSLELLDSCFKQDPKIARQLLTMELDHWSKQTCLTLAVMANHRMLLGHPCCQILLADLWMGALNLRRNSSVKIVVGILLPPLVFFWDYKSTEELKLLPHKERVDAPMMTGANAELNYDTESLRTYSRSRGSHSSFFQKSNHGRTEDLSRDGDGTVIAPTVNLQEVNAKLKEFKLSPPEHRHRHAHFHEKRPILDSGAAGSYIFDGTENAAAKLQKNRKHEDSRRHHQKLIHEVPMSSFVTTKHDLSPWSKFYEFQRAPVTNFYRHTLAYILFVSILAYVILVPQDRVYPSYLEYYLICYVGTHGCDCVREFLSIDAINWAQKWSVFKTKYFCLMDISMVVFFMTGASLRLSGSFNTGFLLYRVSSIYWNLRLYKYMGVHRFVGPKIVMMTRMLKHMAYFAMIIFVVLIAFGIARESIRFPDSEPTWRSIAEAFLEPYVMMFGEVDTDSLSANCGGSEEPECPTGHWIVPITWVIYMMVANILIVNVLIAVFNGIYSEVDAISLELWMFQRFTFVMEFEQKPLLPPPLIVISHFYSIVKYLIEKFVMCLCDQELNAKGVEYEEGPRVIMGNDHNLKTFLTSAEACMVFDFEEDNVDILGTSNERLRNKATDQGDKLREQAPTTITEKMETARNGSIAHVKGSIREIISELSEQRRKLDKLLEIWEMANEEDDAEDEGIKSVVIAKNVSIDTAGNKSKVAGTTDHSKDYHTQAKNA